MSVSPNKRLSRKGSVTARGLSAETKRAYADLAPQKPPKAFNTVPVAPDSTKAKYTLSQEPWDGSPNWSFDKATARPTPPEKPKPKAQAAPPAIMFTAPNEDKRDPAAAKKEVDQLDRKRRQRALSKYSKRMSKLPKGNNTHVARERMRAEFSGVFQMYCKRCGSPHCKDDACLTLT